MSNRYTRQLWEIREASVEPKRFTDFSLYDGYVDEYFCGGGIASEYVLFYIIDELHRKNSLLRKKLHIQKQRARSLRKKLKKAGTFEAIYNDDKGESGLLEDDI